MKPKMRSIESKPQEKTRSRGTDRGLWVIILVLLFAGIVANFYFGSVDWALRVAAGIILVAVLITLAMQTTAGKKAWIFIKSARGELRKVVWPTRQETVQTTLVVVVMVIVTAIFLWGVDSLFLWLIGLLTGQRG